MTVPRSAHTRMAHPVLRISASSGLPMQPAWAAPCVLDLLDRVDPRAHADQGTVI
jgi:hypothetical protein